MTTEANKGSPRLNLKIISGKEKTAVQEEESKKPQLQQSNDSFDDSCSSSEDDSEFFDSDDGAGTLDAGVKTIQVTKLT